MSEIGQSRIFQRPIEIISLFLSTSGLVAVGLLCAEIFEPLRALAGGGFLSALIWVFAPKSTAKAPALNNQKELAVIITLLTLALFFRSDPYLWVGGGQDQGTYVNMASHFEKAGSPFLRDEVRANLSDELKQKYDESNTVLQTNRINYVEGKREGVYLPGIYVADLEESKYVFQFYPIHPVWMAIFERVFGPKAKVFSLPFFGLLSVLFFYLILRQLTNHALLSFFGASLLSLNPLHAFFSKFPVAEVPALAFSLGGLFFLLRALTPKLTTRTRAYLLLISALSFASMFFTRISGFMFIPTIMVGFIFNETFSKERAQRIMIRAYLIALAVCFGLSVLYGLHYSFPYTSDTFYFSVQRVLGKNSEQILISVLVAFALASGVSISFGKHSHQRSHEIAEMLLNWFLKVTPALILIALIYSAYMAYQLAFTNTFAESRIASRWGAAELGWASIQHWSLSVFLSHLSPGIAVFLLIFLRSTWREARLSTKFLGLCATSFFTYIALIKWFVPYQYYFARYQLSELLPLTLLVSLLLFWQLLQSDARKASKMLAAFLMLSSVPYSLAITVGQLGLTEQEGLFEAVKVIEAEAGRDSIVLIDSRRLDLPYAGDLKTALTFNTSLRIISASPEDEFLFLEHFCSKSERISRLSKIADSEAARIDLTAPMYKQLPSPFLERHKDTSSTVFLRKVNCDVERLNEVSRSGILYEEQRSAFGTIAGFYPGSDWTRGKVTFTYPLPVTMGSRIEISSFGWAPLRLRRQSGFLTALANKQTLPCNLVDDRTFHCDTTDLHTIDQLELTFRTWRPVDQGINDDDNVYGLDIQSVRIR